MIKNECICLLLVYVFFLPFYFFTFLPFYFFTLLIKESQQPEGYLIVLADFRVVAGVNRIGRVLYFIMYVGITDAEL